MRSLYLGLLLIYTTAAGAMDLQDLWLRPDQQGVILLKQGNYKAAAATFQNPQWQAVAKYRAGDYEQAAQQFTQLNTADAMYNQANALALHGDYQAAIKAYTQALANNPQHEDARFNREIIKKLLKQQAKNKSQKNKSSQKNKPQQKSDEQKNPQQDPKANKPDQKNSEQAKKNQSQSQKDLKNPPPPEKAKPADTPPAAKKSPEELSADTNNAKQAMPKAPLKKMPVNKSSDKKATEQANEQWLQQIPDDPGGLLRQKFLRDHERMQTGNNQ